MNPQTEPPQYSCTRTCHYSINRIKDSQGRDQPDCIPSRSLLLFHYRAHSDGIQCSWRIIFDLSAPEGLLVNNGIPKEYGAIMYKSVEDAMRLVAKAGSGAKLIQFTAIDGGGVSMASKGTHRPRNPTASFYLLRFAHHCHHCLPLTVQAKRKNMPRKTTRQRPIATPHRSSPQKC